MNAESRTDDHILDGQTYLRRAIANLEKWQKLCSEKPKQLSKRVERMLNELKKGME